ncbi:MAG: BBP7 family outer membrane beta-barrel protein [Thermoguttaceae bacterium]
MQRLGIALFVSFALCGVSTAWAQYGMYGSPDVLPVQQYPAQPAAAAAYQPHQPGAQYQYPAPTAQPVAWTAPVDQPALMQPIPTPSPDPSTVGQPSRGYAPPQGSGMMNQMIAEQGNGCGCGDNAACGQSACCGPCCDRLWYASVSALALTRSPGRRMWTSSEKFPHEDIQLGNTDFPMAWSWGGEVQLGRHFCCDCTPYAIEATFWTTNAPTGSQTTTSSLGTGTLIGTPLQTDNIDLNLPGGLIVPMTDIFTNAISSTVSRRDEFYDFEINLIREKMAWCCDSCWEIGWSLGVRYFRFQESLSVSAVTTDAIIPGGADAYFNNTVTNNLVGPQIGFDLAYNLGCNVRLFLTPSFGIYANWIDSNFAARGRQGTGDYVDATNTIAGYPGYPAHGTGTGIAFLTQIDLGLDWKFTQNWSAKVGYRVVAITGVGLADDEYPQYLCDTLEMQNPQHTSSLVLHGAFLGLTYNF